MSILAKSWLLYLACAPLDSIRAADAKPPAPPPSLAQIQRQAEAARKENRVDDAIRLYKKGVAVKPSWEEGWWSLGTLHYTLNHFVDARDAFGHVAAIQ